ncbi:MAG: hypothetical protein BGN88_10630 [Clostridiales bacterium 43-6]|nr:MAG: hypothetical protein BGN88_10630 [Clostridiales bacterium 43-6]
MIWEPNSTGHLTSVYGGPDGSSKIDTIEAAKGLLLTDVDDQTTYDFQTGDTNISGDDTKISLFNVRMDAPQKFNVYIWVEGSDPDTQNAVAKSDFATLLTFGQATGTLLP